MNIYAIRLQGFRNYVNLQIKLNDGLNIFTGDNAQGKTNIIEAIYYASLGTSYRSKKDNDLINWHADNAKIEILYKRLDIDNRLDITLSKLSRKKILLNQEPLQQKNLPGNLIAVLFAPEDLTIVKGAPALRRRFLDIELSQTDHFYYSSLVQFNRLLLQRNNLLKEIKRKHQAAAQLDVWDSQLAQAAAFIWQRRLKAVQELDNLAAILLQKIAGSNEKLRLSYKVGAACSNVSQQQWAQVYRQELHDRREADIWRGSTGAGPHHDDLEFYLNDVDVKAFGSQGQQRSVVLALKLAELEYIKSIFQQYPVLLLDDVMSELDLSRRTQMLDFLSKHQIQCFVTATDRTMFSDVAAAFYRVQQGTVEEDR